MTAPADPAAGRLYLAGPMSGLPLFNFPAFAAARTDLRARGFDVWCPAEHDELAGFDPLFSAADTFANYMARDLQEVCRSAGVIVLPGWESSRGANLEVVVARALGLPVHAYPSLAPIDSSEVETILAEANRIIHGPRRDGYGHPLANFGNTAALWTAHLRTRGLLAAGAEVQPEDVGWMMVQVKQARELNGHSRDSLVDAAGYVGTIHMCIEERARLAQAEGGQL